MPKSKLRSVPGRRKSRRISRRFRIDRRSLLPSSAEEGAGGGGSQCWRGGRPPLTPPYQGGELLAARPSSAEEGAGGGGSPCRRGGRPPLTPPYQGGELLAQIRAVSRVRGRNLNE